MADFYSFVGISTIVLIAFYIIGKIFKGIWTTYLGSALGFGYNFKHSDDAFAIVTGATDGIGYEYACFFAKKGYNLLLISRNQQKLEDTKQKISEKYSQCKEIRIHQADFTNIDIYEGIKKSVEALPRVDVLVNNVGISYKYPEYLTKLPSDESWKLIDDLIHVNILSVTRMFQIVLPIMEANRKGLIINISSFSATYPTPLLAVYGATKTYVDFLSRSLTQEYSGKNITIQSVLPQFVSTNMSKMRRATLMVPKPKDYVEAAMKTVGFESRTYGYAPHKFVGFLMDCVVGNLISSDYNSKIVFNNLKAVRKAAYRKNNLKE